MDYLDATLLTYIFFQNNKKIVFFGIDKIIIV